MRIGKGGVMLSLLQQELGARSFRYIAAVAVVILVVTIAVSAIWEKMVYTIPVLAVLLFLAAGLEGVSRGSTSRNLDEEGAGPDTDSETNLDAN